MLYIDTLQLRDEKTFFTRLTKRNKREESQQIHTDRKLQRNIQSADTKRNNNIPRGIH